MPVSASRYGERYRALNVSFDDGTTGIFSPSNYRMGIGDTQTKDSLWQSLRQHFRAESGLSVDVFVGSSRSATTHEFATRDELRYTALNAFWGKASPEEMQVTLQLLDKFGVKPRAELAAYCGTTNIGVDCSGFVGNYLAREIGSTAWTSRVGRGVVGPSTKSNAIFNHYSANRITSLDQLRTAHQYLLAYCNTQGSPHSSDPTGHIMITAKPRVDQLTCRETGPAGRTQGSDGRFTVSESTGGIGVVTSEYSVESSHRVGTRQAYFTVYRGCKRTTFNVAITKLN